MAPSFPVPVHVGERLGRHHFRFRSIFGAKIEAGRGTCANGSRAGPIGNRDTWSDQRVRLERGPLSVRSCNCTKFVSHLVLVDCETFDGCEVTRAHHMEVLPTRSERSSMTLEIRDLVWLAFLAREVVERGLAKPMSQIYLNLQAFDMHLNFLAHPPSLGYNGYIMVC